MLSVSRRSVLVAGAMVGTAVVAVPAALAATSGGGTPANKAVAAGAKTEAIAPGSEVTLMSATFKTSKPEDLLISVSAECSILTDVVIEGGPNATAETSSARGLVRVWVEVDGKIVPIQDTSTPPQDPAANGNG